MLVPPQNTLVFRGFGYNILDGKDPDNKPVKILAFQDPPRVAACLNVCFVFSEEEFVAFQKNLSESTPPPNV